MKHSTLAAALLAWAVSVAAGPAPDDEIAYKSMTQVGCYSQVPTFKDLGKYTYQSSGYCQRQCVPQGYPVMALYDGGHCLCGKKLPPKSTKTDKSNCDKSCDGWPEEYCGGSDAYTVILTGLEDDVPTMDDTSATTDGVSKTLTTQAGKTIWVTAEPEQKSDEDGGGPNPAGIAAGVVVGILGMVGILAGAFFFYKRQKRKRAEEEYRRAQDINSFVSAAKHPPSEDSRWDGEYMAQRRYSNGSIADDEDYSRRILKVTNPDR